MTQVTNDLIYEILKQLQTGQTELRTLLSDHTRQFIRIREDINALRGDDLRLESFQPQIDTRLERIETRLKLNEV